MPSTSSSTGCDSPPNGIIPLYLRNTTLEKYGFKTGEGVKDVVDYLYINREKILQEIQFAGVMCDFQPIQKILSSMNSEEILIVMDKTEKYGEMSLIYTTIEMESEYFKSLEDLNDAIQKQNDELEVANQQKSVENIVFIDKPMELNPWNHITSQETEAEILQMTNIPIRSPIILEFTRPKKLMNQKIRFTDRNSDVGGIAEFRAYKDTNFMPIRELEHGIQVAAIVQDNTSQTSYYRMVNKGIQYEPVGGTNDSIYGPKTQIGLVPPPIPGQTTTTTTPPPPVMKHSISTSTETTTPIINNHLLSFLENATLEIEKALQQNESVDIFNEAFQLNSDDIDDLAASESELRELKNFADANYSKGKALICVDWMPKTSGMVAVSAVRNITFDQRIQILGQTYSSYVMLWDFRLLVKPLILMQSHHEVVTFRFNRTTNTKIVGGLITGQVVMWDIQDAMNIALKKNNRSSGSNNKGRNMNNNNILGNIDDDEEEVILAPVLPTMISSVDYSHRKAVADLYWLPPTTQINYRGQLVADEHLDGLSHQFVTVAGDGLVMVWDTRYEQIFNDELRFIARSRHIPTEKASAKEGGALRPLWAPIFKTHLKRLEGVSELSLCKVCESSAHIKNQALSIGKAQPFSGDGRSQLIIATEEGDILFVDLSTRRTENSTRTGGGDDDDDDDGEVSCVKWIASDHPRPSVKLQESPFFPNIVLSVSDWCFHIWKLGEDIPLFSSPISSTYLTTGAWSTTRPAVLFVAGADGQIMAWDFTDSGFRPAVELKATHARITSLELLPAAPTARHQLMAVGDEVGTLHIFELPRSVTKAVPKEEALMARFLEREMQRLDLTKSQSEGQFINAPAPQDPYDLPPMSTRVPEGDENNATVAAEEVVVDEEEEEFLKLEAAFRAELGLQPLVE